MSRHTIIAECEVRFRVPGLVDFERANPKVEITYEFFPAQRAIVPRGEYAPIDPPEPASVELVSAKLIDGDGLDPSEADVQEWANDWLDDDCNWQIAIEHAEDTRQYGRDPDEWLDEKRDREADRDDWWERD